MRFPLLAKFVLLHQFCGYVSEFYWSSHYEYYLNESPEVAARQPLGLVGVLIELPPVCQLQRRSEDVAYSV